MLKSLSVSNPDLLFTIHSFVRDISPDDLEPIESALEYFPNLAIKPYFMTSNIIYKEGLKHISVSTMDRLYVVNHITDASINRVLYLDIDLLVVGKIDQLFTDIDTGVTGIAARNSLGQNVVRMWLKDFYQEDNIYPHSNGFNAGVLVLDLFKLRSNNYIDTINKLSEYGFNDQIVLNIYADNKHTALDIKFNHFGTKERRIFHPFSRVNSFNPLFNIDLLVKDIRILHFVGSRKPWNTTMPYTAMWNYFENLTGNPNTIES